MWGTLRRRVERGLASLRFTRRRDCGLDKHARPVAVASQAASTGAGWPGPRLARLARPDLALVAALETQPAGALHSARCTCLCPLLALTPPPPSQSNPNLRPATYTSLTRSTFPQHRPLADFVAAFLLYSRDADLTDTPDALEKQYTLLEDCFKCAPPLAASLSLPRLD